MVDRDSIKSFTIPKTYTSNKDVLIPEKVDSRNVSELFNDIKSCALEAHFDFRQNECKSCDTIRNQKLQKLFNERRTQMKKNQDPTERFAFHVITSRDMALNIATDGLTCEQLSFSIDKYLGNPKDGIHLSRRPDVLLASTGPRNLCKFGVLVCKILLGKGYATLPSTNNKELCAQLHYDYHFCKIQTFNKEQRHINELLADSLIFCYEHQDLQTLSHPSQILPLAILWYDLNEKFSSELVPTSQESQQRNGKPIKSTNFYKTKPAIKPIPKPLLSATNGTWEEPIQETTNTPPIQITPTKYPSQFMIPYSSLYTSFSSLQPLTLCRDPRLTRKLSASETIPLSPQKSLVDKSFSPSKQITTEKEIPAVDIPLNATSQLIDPRLQTLKQTHDVCYLESKAVKHALQQQKRLNNYYDSKAEPGLKKTSYAPIPFVIRSMSLDEYERQNHKSKNSTHKDYSSLYVSVIDCFHFGLNKTTDQLCVDLEDNENQLAYEQIQMSNQLIQHEKQLNSQERRLQLREKRQRKLQERSDEQRKTELSNSKMYINNGRKLLREHRIRTPTNHQLSFELLDFFSYEYLHETRPYVKRILAELLGIFIEKYGAQSKSPKANDSANNDIEVSSVDDPKIYSVIDMDLESPASQLLGDHDERFSIQTPSVVQSIDNPLQTSLLLPQVSSQRANQISDDFDSNQIQSQQIELPSSEPDLSTDDTTFARMIKETKVLSNINTKTNDTNDNSKQMMRPDSSIQIENDSNRSREEFSKQLTKEVQISKSPTPPTLSDDHRRSYGGDEATTVNKKLSSTRTVMLVSSRHEDNLIIQTPNIEHKEEEEEEEPTVKRIRVDRILPTNEGVKSRGILTDDYDSRRDFDDRRQQEVMNNKTSRSRSISISSQNSSIKDFRGRSPLSSSSSGRMLSNKNRYQQQQRQRKDCDYEHNRSFEKSNHYHQQNMNNTSSSPSPRPRHQRFNYNHQSIAEHSRFAQVDNVSSGVKGYNQNSFNTYNNSNYYNSSPMTNTDRKQNASYFNETSSDNRQYYQDNYESNLLRPPPPLMSTVPAMNFSNAYDSKPSNTIERLQMFLQEKTTTSHDPRQSSTTDYSSSSSSYMVNSHQDNNQSPWFSTRHSTRTTTSSNIQNNQNLSYNAAEQLLTFVQHLHK